ncbi:hypothetical protein L6164_004016 [Bauhinia variegata]|uniref:Uncharacterized protein n=1 Tax=Bauhinia variegata TaxID=167791 RepID=A0ACB9Q2L0_BAUVA|nr:hypothetical protein L6164_004016 [Bauhinia variegata]
MERSLREAENSLKEALTNEVERTPNLGATRFAANVSENLQQNGEFRNRFSQKMLPLLLQKPAEPDFSTKQN